MAAEYSYKEGCLSPENEYLAEQVKYRLQYSLANFAQIRFKRAMQSRMSAAGENN